MKPVIFISYAWESDAHSKWVSQLADLLAKSGFEVVFDRNLSFGDDFTKFMETIRSARFVLLICTPAYFERANSRSGGAGYETGIITSEIYSNSELPGKFVPILRSGDPGTSVPIYIQNRLFLDFRDRGEIGEGSDPFERLVSHLKKFSDADGLLRGDPVQAGLENPSAADVVGKFWSRNSSGGAQEAHRLREHIRSLGTIRQREIMIRSLVDWFCEPPQRLDLNASRAMRQDVLAVIREEGARPLKEYFGAKRLEGLDLVRMDFSGADLTGISFSGSFLILSTFAGSDLSGANLSKCYIRNVNFSDARLADADFSGSDWFNALGLCLAQIQEAKIGTLRAMPRTSDELFRFLKRNYGIPFDKWKPEGRRQVVESWASYLGKPQEEWLSFLDSH